MQGDPDAALSIGGEGTISVQLGPVIEAVKQRLVEQGVGFAASIPVVDRSIVVAQNDAFVLVQTFTRSRSRSAPGCPWIVLALLVAGVLVAKRRPKALVWTAGGFALTMAILAAGTRRRPNVLHRYRESVDHARRHRRGALRRAHRAHALDDRRVPRARHPRRGHRVVLGAVAAGAGGRGFAGSGFAAPAIRRGARRHHGVVRHRLDRWRGFVYTPIAIVAAAVLLLSRPVSVGVVLWTVVLALIALLIVELLRRPAEEVAAAAIRRNDATRYPTHTDSEVASAPVTARPPDDAGAPRAKLPEE